MRSQAWLGLVAAVALAACRDRDDARPSAPIGSAGKPPATLRAADDPWSPTQPPRQLDPPKIHHPLEHPMLWTATKAGHVTYLLGTYHVGVDADDRLPRWLWDHFEAASTLMVETDIADPALMQWTIRAPGPSLSAELGPHYWALLQSVVTPAAAERLDQGATAVAVLQVAGLGGTAVTTPMDGMLVVRAQGLRKPIVFLEDARLQADLLTTLMTATALERLLDQRDQLPELNRRYFDAYVAGDAETFARTGDALTRLQVASAAEAEALDRKLLVDRNRSWVPAIERAHAAGAAFVAVGALHLVAAHNLLDMLRERGFVVERAVR